MGKGIIAKLKRRWAERANEPPEGAYNSKIFRAIIGRERARADRNAHVFSLVVFHVDRASRASAAARELVARLQQRIRFTDVIGCLDNRRIGALLPETRSVGAATFARDVQRDLSAATRVSRVTIHTYPADGNVEAPDEDPRQLTLPHLFETTERPAGDTHSGQAAMAAARDETERGFFSDIIPLAAPGVPAWKRLLDIAGALLALFLLSPLFLLVALLIKLVSRGPVFYSQTRVGYLGRTFDCWKFRTMHVDADQELHRRHVQEVIPDEAPLEKLDGRDPRIIRGGRFLRATGLDELPQLFNVLRGEMSLVGPRPDVPYAVDKYDRWNVRRFDTVPGLTGLWQVSGKNRTTHVQMMRLDIHYAQRRSPWLDFKIFLKTLPAIMAETRYALFKHHGRHDHGAPGGAYSKRS